MGKRLTADQHEQMKATVGNAAIFRDGQQVSEQLRTAHAVEEERKATQKAMFIECRKPISPEDSCPICYDEMTSSPCLNCPTCSNNVHRECMEVWLERNASCVYCRSNVWRLWN